MTGGAVAGRGSGAVIPALHRACLAAGAAGHGARGPRAGGPRELTRETGVAQLMQSEARRGTRACSAQLDTHSGTEQRQDKDMTGRDETRQDKTRHDKTRQDETRQDQWCACHVCTRVVCTVPSTQDRWMEERGVRGRRTGHEHTPAVLQVPATQE